MSQKEKYNDLMSAIKEDEEKKEEQNRFDATLEQTKEAHSLARKTLDATREANDNNVKIQKGINAAALSADNILTRICAAIFKAENTTIKARLDDESMKQLHDMPGVIEQAAAAYSPAMIANFTYDLAKAFNSFYQDTPILRENDHSSCQS